MRVSVEDANRDLIRRVGQEFLPKTREQVGGASAFDTFSPAQQQAALTSIAYNYGQLPRSHHRGCSYWLRSEIANAIRGGLVGTTTA